MTDYLANQVGDIFGLLNDAVGLATAGRDQPVDRRVLRTSSAGG